MAEQSPSEIAREVLRRLASERRLPTPENFRDIYNQIAGIASEDVFPERQFKMLAATLPRATAEQLRVARRFESATAERNWQVFKAQLAALLSEQSVAPQPWATLITELMTQLARRQAGISEGAKREALQRLLEANTADPDLLFTRLQGLLRGWAQMPAAAVAAIEVAEIPAAAAPRSNQIASGSFATTTLTGAPETWRELMAQTMESAIGMLLIDTPELANESQALARAIRDPGTIDDEAFEERLKQFSYRVQWIAQDQSYIRQALLNLLQLVLENIGELVVDDKWLSGQMSVLLELFSRPLDKGVIEEVRERLRDVIYKQGTLKRSLSEAQTMLREMLSNFVERLSELADSTGNYHDKIEAFAERVAKAESIDELSGLIGDVMNETRKVELRTRESQTELVSLRRTVDHAYHEIARLEEELELASAMVRHDPLTGALNRKGLEETMAREIARMRRRNSTLCIALLDVDDFKKINDKLGHSAGDEALKHLAMVIRETLRPQDSCGRYGGEEFVILLPDTRIEDAAHALTRLQRELTKRFFLHDNMKLLITFSAGVTQLGLEEAPDVAIDRADKAMYRAKRAGKNRVEAD